MAIFKRQLSKRTKIQVAIICAVILAIIALIVTDFTLGGPISYLLTNKEEVINVVRNWGFLGPIAFVFIQALQTILAPIPLSTTGIIGGFLFGWWGILWTTIGSIIGFWAIFWLSRKFGRSLIEKIIKPESLAKFDNLAKDKGAPFFFLIFLIPGLPDDVAGYIAGLTKIPIRVLLALAIVGRTPSVIATNMFGAGLGEDNIIPVVTIAAISVIIFAFISVKHDAIMKYLKHGPNRKK